jgi:hypothetical protein
MNNQQKNIHISLNYENKIIQLEDEIVYVTTKNDGEIVIGFNHEYMTGEGVGLKINNHIYDGNYIFYIKENILNVYFE